MRYRSRLPFVLPFVLPCLLAGVLSGCPSKSAAPPSIHAGGPKPDPTPVLPLEGPDCQGPMPPARPVPAEQRYASWCQQEMDAARAQREIILGVAGGHTLDNTLVPYNLLLVHLDNALSRSGLTGEAHPDEKVRAAADQCTQDASSVYTTYSLDRPLYDAIAAVDAKGLDAEAKRFYDHTLREFRRAGVDKDDQTRARLQELNDEETKAGQEFDKNIRDDVRTIEVDPAQLDGLPQDWIDAHKPNAAGKVVVNTDYPDYLPFRTYAKDAGARLALYKVYLNRGWPQNDAVFKRLLKARQEHAKLLGYKDWADYVTETKMIGSGKNARSFIEKITKLSAKSAKRDYAALLARYKKDNPKAKAIALSDVLFYEELIRRENFALDSQEVREYFDFTRTRDGVLQIIARLYDVEFKELKDAERWHPDVDVYDVFAKADKKKLGRIYLDLHPRENKYKHAAEFPIVAGVDGVQLPEAALECNLDKGLILHNDVYSCMFHEFGHLMHQILGGHVKWITFSGTSVERDFVEAPSQMFEEWAWDADVLALFATDAKGKTIPKELVEKMRAAQEFGEGYRARTQMFYASMALRFHQLDASKDFDTTKVLKEEQAKYSMFPYIADTHFHMNFGHLNGYSAMYYTYMWSLVIAKDMFTAFQTAGMLDETTAHRYRDMVLARGGSKDAAELVQDFLGRPYDFDAFTKWLEHAK